VRLRGEGDHIHQLDRCLTDSSMPLDLRVGGALVLLFGMLVSRITQLTKDDVTEDGPVTCLAIDGNRLALPPRLASLVRQLRDQDEQRWTLARLGTPAPWLFPGQSPARPAVDVLFGVRLQYHGINAHAGRNTARLANCRPRSWPTSPASAPPNAGLNGPSETGPRMSPRGQPMPRPPPSMKCPGTSELGIPGRISSVDVAVPAAT
jgi:hypothetical protein